RRAIRTERDPSGDSGLSRYPGGVYSHHTREPLSSAAEESEWERRMEHDGTGAHHSHAESDSKHGHGDHVVMFRQRFWWSLLLTAPVVVTSEMVMDWFGYDLNFAGIDWIGPVLGSIIFFWAGWPFLSGGWSEL